MNAMPTAKAYAPVAGDGYQHGHDACNAILGALVARERGGSGAGVEVSLFDNAVLMTGYATMQHLFAAQNPHGTATQPRQCRQACFRRVTVPSI